MEKAVIVAALRTPIGRARKGAYIYTRIDDIAAQLVKALIAKAPELPKEKIEDVIFGCAMPEGDQGLNVARNISFLAGLPFGCGGMTVNRFCASSLEGMNIAAQAVMCGNGEAFVVGGIESMTHIPMGGFNPSLNEKLMKPGAPDAYIGMGETAENLAKKYSISRGEQDRFALSSHRKAAHAQEKGYFEKEIVPIEIISPSNKIPPSPPFEKGGMGGIFITKDECVRADTSIEKLAELKPSFIKDGTVTAGNSSPLSDGAAAVIVMSKRLAKKLGIRPMAQIIGMGVAGVDPALMGMGPVYSVPKALARAGIKLKNIDLFELNEAFAAQSLAVIRELVLDPAKTNVHGGAIALGHPLGSSGARLVTTLIHAMKGLNKNLGLATMCVGGGQGVATVVEQL